MRTENIMRNNKMYIGFKSKALGVLGEKASSKYLQMLPADEYTLFNDVIIKNESETTQIDHIVFSTFGIFVIETKNYSGLITGSGKSIQWTQYLQHEKHYFKNPIYQNYGHIKALSNLLNLPENKFVSIVAFSMNSKLQLLNADNVIYINQLPNEILLYKTKCLHPVLLKGYIEKIKESNIDSFGASFLHDIEVYKKKTISESRIANGICPKCGGKLLLRNGKYGSFYGCSNYPKCRFIQKDI